MSTWRKKAIECLPKFKKEFEKRDTSIYDVFMELLPATVVAHNKSDIAQLQKNYDFAAWCFTQKTKELWNAAGVCFYEHLGDAEETWASMPQWVNSDIYCQIRPLLALRLNSARLKTIDRLYGLPMAK